MNEKIAIAYFSHTGNTKQAAKKLQREVGGDLIEIRKRRPYRSSQRMIMTKSILAFLSGVDVVLKLLLALRSLVIFIREQLFPSIQVVDLWLVIVKLSFSVSISMRVLKNLST